MKDYQIFSDSSCDTPPQLLSEFNIQLIPYYVTFDQENYMKENIEITNSQFYETLNSGNVFPKTSLPSVQDYMNVFEEAIKAEKDVLCICLSHKFSGSYQSAVNAKLILEEKYTDAKISIIDSIQATAGQGLVVLQAAYMKQAGYSIDDTIEKLEELKQTARIMFTVDTLEYLAKGGRIGKATSLAGTMLNLKPLIQLKDAELIPYSNVRGRKKSLEKVLSMVEEYFTEHNESYDDYDFCFANATTLDEVNAFKPRVEALIGKSIDYPIFQIGVTIGTYTGPGALGVCFIKKFK
ncbi:DegV family protein [Anaeromicropila herbilytica]|uniref:6-phosphogluconate dehydratase n=1 Tax=Anaeromicropila herbilytica TaxID=2785025 RepID=A0A7R7ENI9_9FIRM|nr:DegV family protein [Anaeromicropila herbilytica]BCN32124.1 6-phosphogluconate dehydratase [Anaeromicropila herbilytica]